MNKMKYYGLIVCLSASLVAGSCQFGGNSPGSLAGLRPGEFGAVSFDNGLRMMVHPAPVPESQLVTIAIRLAAGVQAEQEGEEGYSSVLASVFGRTGLGTVAARMKARGSALTVDLQRDGLLLSATVLKEDARETASDLFDLLTKTFAEETVNASRDMVIDRLEALANSGTFSLSNILDASLFQGTPYVADSGQRLSSVSQLSAESFSAFTERIIRAESVSIALVGAIDMRLIDEISIKAAGWSTSDIESEETAVEEESGEETRVEQAYVPIRVRDVESSQCALYLLRRLPGLDAEDYYALQAVNLILNGGSTGGRLRAASATLGLEDPIRSDLNLYNADSSHVITIISPAARAELAFSAVLQQLQLLHEGTVLNTRLLEQEVADARNNLAGQLLRRTESGVQIAHFLLWADQHGFELLQPSEHMAMIKSLDKKRMLEVIDSYYIPRLTSLVAVGPEVVLRGQLEDFGSVEVIR